MLETLVKLFIAVVFAILAVLMWRGWQDRKASPGWPDVEGTITQADVKRDIDDPQNEVTHVAWRLEVRYDYQVEGQTFHGDRVRALPDRYYSEESARAALMAYPIGAKARVYYNPAKPDSSVLKPG
jgi:hypothetical protein